VWLRPSTPQGAQPTFSGARVPGTAPRAAPPGGMEMQRDSAPDRGLLVSPEARAELFHNAMAVADATEEFVRRAAASANALVEQHVHTDNVNAVLKQANLFLTTDKIHPLAKAGGMGVSLLLLKGLVFFVLRWFVLGFLCVSSYRYIDEKFPRIPDAERQEGVLVINERRTLALAGYGVLCVWLFLTLF
jgi:hypothetical protein